METTPGAEGGRRRRGAATLLVAGALTVLAPLSALQAGHAAQLKVTSAPLQSWTVEVLLSDLPVVPEAELVRSVPPAAPLPTPDVQLPEPAQPTPGRDSTPGPSDQEPAAIPGTPQDSPAPSDGAPQAPLTEGDQLGTP
jgi:hypothetical protein